MSAPHPIPDSADETDSPNGWERALLDRQLERLDRLAEMGMAIAGAIERRATAADAGPDSALRHAAIDFARVARAVRMTFALQSRLIADFKARSRPAGDDESGDGVLEVRWMGIPSREPEVRKDRVQRAVRRAATAAGHDIETVERLAREAGERLEQDDIHGVMTRQFDDIIALICQELGLEAPAAEMAQAPFPLDGRGAGDGGDLSAVQGRNRHPLSRPLPHQGGEEIIHRSP